MELSSFPKYLGLQLRQQLTFERYCLNSLNNMLCKIETLYTVKTLNPGIFCLKLLNTLVLGPLQRTAVLLNGIT